VSQNRLVMVGLEEFKRQLRQLPEELASEADTIVQAHATEAQAAIQRAYPEGPTGNLRRGVTRTRESSRFGSRAIVRSRAKHASLYEYGTKPRRNSRGANRGTMPVAPESSRMIPIIVRKRRAMVAALIDLVRRAGLKVDGV
jgi:bacteriophage HK97-gp10 putative tail-component